MQNNVTTPLFIVMVMLLASLSPLAMAAPISNSDVSEISYGNLEGFDPSIEGKKYMFVNESEPAFSATGPVSYTHLTLPTKA